MDGSFFKPNLKQERFVCSFLSIPAFIISSEKINIIYFKQYNTIFENFLHISLGQAVPVVTQFYTIYTYYQLDYLTNLHTPIIVTEIDRKMANHHVKAFKSAWGY